MGFSEERHPNKKNNKKMSTGYYMRSVPDLKFGSNKKCTIFNVTGSNDTVKLPAFENPPLLDRLL